MKYSDSVVLLAMLLGSIVTSADAAEFQRADVFQLNERSLQIRWNEGEAFFDMWQRESQKSRHVFLTGGKNVLVRYDLKHAGRKKNKLRLSPKVFIRPVLIIEELQTFFRAYQTRETASVDVNTQIKAIIPLDALARAKPVAANAKRISFMPYYHKVYGIYLQITW